MIIKNSTPEDLHDILRLYEFARTLQKIKGAVLWPEFDKALIEKEIAEKRQWNIQIDGRFACVWAITFNDPQIWEERNSDPAVYIHRIATHPAFRGRNLVAEMVTWVRHYAAENNKAYIRMDTVGENRGLIDYYQKCGFNFLGLVKLKDTENLPAHYHNATVSLFEISLNPH
jgi:ribosomal protein S18 acetylase RimI-like enzyme